MKDDRGKFYYPFPANKNVRMYVRPAGGTIEFRLWSQEDPGLWMEHGWVPYEAIREAAGMYSGGPFDPDRTYDIDMAWAAIRE